MEETETAIRRQSRREIEESKAWFDNSCEDGLELADAVKASLDQARAEIAAGLSVGHEPEIRERA